MVSTDGNDGIVGYNASLALPEQEICRMLMEAIERHVPGAKRKIWHGSPVWFVEDNPIVGYSKQKRGVQLLFWSGQSFDEEGLSAVGKFKAAEALYVEVGDVEPEPLSRWLDKSLTTQWDYKNIVKNKGELVLRKEDGEPALTE